VPASLYRAAKIPPQSRIPGIRRHPVLLRPARSLLHAAGARRPGNTLFPGSTPC
jgi:hypothetical protein